MSKGIFYVGMDESNHGELKSKIGEIIVACGSFNKRFWEYKKHPNRRDFSRIEERLDQGVDYIYTLLSHNIAKKNYSNLHTVAPFLIDNFFLGCFSNKRIEKVFLGLDGRLNRQDRLGLSENLERRDLEFSIKNFVKRNGVHYGPELIYLSHLIANSIFSNSMEEIARDPRYIPFKELNF